MLMREQPALGSVNTLSVHAACECCLALHTVALHAPRLGIDLDYLRLCNGAFYGPSAIFVAMKSFKSVTRLYLSEVKFSSVHDLRKLVSGFEGLKDLVLRDLRWTPGAIPVQLSVSFRALRQPRLTMLRVACQRDWILDPRSVSFIRWLANSRVSSSVDHLDLYHLTVLDHAMLAAIEDLICASSITLRALFVQFGPEVSLTKSMPLILAIMSTPCAGLTLRFLAADSILLCQRLDSLSIRIPYHAPAFSQLLDLLGCLTSYPAQQLYLDFNPYLSLADPSPEDWVKLDVSMQQPQFKDLKALYISRRPREVGHGKAVAWGDWYPHRQIDGAQLARDIQQFLPLTCKRHIIWYEPQWDTPYCRIID